MMKTIDQSAQSTGTSHHESGPAESRHVQPSQDNSPCQQRACCTVPDGAQTRVISQVRFRWAKARIGRIVLVVCATGKAGEEACADAKCRLKPFCNCAREEDRNLNAVKSRIWILASLCGLAVILYWLFRTPPP